MNNEQTADVSASMQPASLSWLEWAPIVLAGGLATSALDSVRKGTEPSLGRWAACGVGLVSAAIVGVVVFSFVKWVVQRERSEPANGLAPMVYRPLAMPLFIFCGALLQNITAVWTDVAPWAYVISLLVLIVPCVLLQRRRGRAWGWWMALFAGFALTFIAWLLANGATIVIAHPTRAGEVEVKGY